MRDFLNQLHPALENRFRIGILSVLLRLGPQDFKALKMTLDLTDGNLASHLKALEASGLVECFKQFIGRKPNTTYKPTEAGQAAFFSHLNALDGLRGIAPEPA